MEIRTTEQHGEGDLSYGIAHQLEEICRSIPFIQKIDRPCDKPDQPNNLIFSLKIGNDARTIFVEAKQVGQPRNTKAAIASWNMRKKQFPDAYFLFAAPYVSDSSRAICKDSGVGYVDLQGNCFISFDKIFIDRFGFEKEAESRQLQSVFKEKASRVLRRLLTDPAGPWHVQQLAKEASVSIGLVSQIKTKLMDSEILEQRGEAFTVIQPEQLLRQWALEYPFKKHKAVEFYSPLSLNELETLISQKCISTGIEHAFTLATAAKMTGVEHAKGVSRIHIYTQQEPHIIAERLGFKYVESGGNVIILQPFDTDILYNTRQIQGLCVVSDLQLYLDFSAQKGRVQETAEVLFDTRIKLGWEESDFAPADES